MRRAVGLLAIALVAGAVGLAAHSSGAFSWLERASVDVRFSLRSARRPPSDIVIVGIDDESLAELPRYPFSRRLHARLIEQLHSAGARLIVYDVAFDRPTTAGADEALLNAAARGAPIVFATSLVTDSGATEVLGGDAVLRELGDSAGAAELRPDGDGTIRHFLGSFSGLPTVATVVARHEGRPRSASPPTHPWIDFPGSPGIFHTLPFVDVLHGRFDANEVRGKIVIVGATAPALQDLHDTAVGGPMPGPEVQAAAISTALRGFPLSDPPGWLTALLIVALALALPTWGMRMGSLATIFAGLMLAALWCVAAQLAFDAGTVVDFSDPLAALALGTVGTAGIGLWDERRERARLRALFAAGAAPVVEQVLDPLRAHPLGPTSIIAGYAVEEMLGRGGMGVVYRAKQLNLDRDVALKLITPERSQDEGFRERFKRESRAAASVEHANVIPVYEAGEDDGLLFIAMRLVDGTDLEQLLHLHGTLAVDRVCALAEQLAGALDAAHAHDLVHRDVKPANVMLTCERPEHAYLMDFGVAMHIGGSGMTAPQQWVGTLDYLAPEQIRGECVDAAADVYALTGLLYRCLTGEIPFPRDNDAAKLWAHVNAPPPAPSRIAERLPGELDGVIERGMAKDPSERFASAGELVCKLVEALTGRTPRGARADLPPSALPQPAPGAPTVLSE